MQIRFASKEVVFDRKLLSNLKLVGNNFKQKINETDLKKSIDIPLENP
jgi:hypothetical protein